MSNGYGLRNLDDHRSDDWLAYRILVRITGEIMSKGLFSVVILSALVIWVLFMGRALFDPNFKPPPPVAALGPALLTGTFGYILSHKKENE